LQPKRRLLIAFSLVLLLAGTGAFAFVVHNEKAAPHNAHLGLVTSRYNFGSGGNSTTGWLVPANTQISTTYVSTEAVNHSLIGSIVVFLYDASGSIQLGLYVNGQLRASSGHEVGSGGGSGFVTSEGNVTNNVANFEYVTTEYTVSIFPLTSPIPAGVVVTVVAEFSSPLWVQIDNSPTTLSYESTVSPSFNSFAATLPQDLGSVAPHTLSVGMGGV
jgi:hypothetical protein